MYEMVPGAYPVLYMGILHVPVQLRALKAAAAPVPSCRNAFGC